MLKKILGVTLTPLHRIFTIALLCLFAVTVFEYVLLNSFIRTQIGKNGIESVSDEVLKEFFVDQHNLKHNITVDKYYEKRKDWVTSNLGTILFKNELPPTQYKNRTFVVLIWKYWDWLKNRHVYGFDHGRAGALDECSVKNCFFTGDPNTIQTADAVVVHIQHGEIPRVMDRNPNQRWIFLTDESPKNSFTMASVKPNLVDWINVFNWSMTYRSDADVPVPYGRTLPLKHPLMPNTFPETISQYVPYWGQKKHDILISILMSNCHVSERMEYLRELQKYIEVDVHGKCSEKNKDSCPGHFRADCKIVTEYLFYLVFENSKCRQYLTEKIFHNALSKGAIPIILGPPKEDCEKLLPPNSFLHVDDYETPKDLANDVKRISKHNESLLAYHQWRNNFQVVNEHGYFESRSFHFCRVCEALNYNDETRKSYRLTDLELFLDPKLLCN